jgi:alkanesulfonate monooxygenase SsuD/methylene tetrahydromethanopterin reductase-like flavin-dependent oxidoreductase (luciferase family)
MHVGLQVIRFDWPGYPDSIGTTLANIGRMADEQGFASLWVMDHFFQMGEPFGPADAPMLEGYGAISYLAGITQRIKLGVLVSGNLYRHPGLLVKTVTTLDVLSGGRAYFGIGAGWYKREAEGLGVPFPLLKERFERLEETLRIAKHMWAGDRSPFTGRATTSSPSRSTARRL